MENYPIQPRLSTEDALMNVLVEFSKARCLVLGDIMLDRFIYGSVSRISPEAPIPVMSVEKETDMPGGAANVSRNLGSVGAQTTLIGAVGCDEIAEILQSRLSQLHGIHTRLVADNSRPTTVKSRFVAEGQQVLRTDHESTRAVSAQIEESLLAEFESALSETDIVILSDYGKGVLSDSVVRRAISAARAAGKLVITDPKSKTFAKYKGASILTPNRHELQLACGFDCETDQAVVRGAQQILSESVCDIMVVTRGKDGMSIVQADGTVDHLRTSAREVFDVSGAGDTVIATLAAALAAGAGIINACRLANIAAGIVVGKRGTAVTTVAEIVAELRPHDGKADPYKLFSSESAVTLVQGWRREGLKVAFTNGCFDLLHPGHVSLIDLARRQADRLIVGINADASVRRLKGSERPIQSEIARATVLASLKSVDAVVIFSEETPMELIDSLQPDVLVKGSDYTLDKVVGADLVISRGGRVVLADLVPGHSTTRTLQKLMFGETRVTG